MLEVISKVFQANLHFADTAGETNTNEKVYGHCMIAQIHKKLLAAFCGFEQSFVRTWCVFELQKPQVVFDVVFGMEVSLKKTYNIVYTKWTGVCTKWTRVKNEDNRR
jgi:hypothetical protein